MYNTLNIRIYDAFSQTDVYDALMNVYLCICEYDFNSIHKKIAIDR